MLIKGTFFILLFATLFLSCHKDTAENTPKPGCNFTNFKYYDSTRKDTLGEMSSSYLTIVFDTTYSESEIRKFISKETVFDQSYHYTFRTNIDSIIKFAIFRFNKSKTCEEITEIINNLQKNPIVSNANFTMNTYFCQTVFGRQAGNLCVVTYTNLFYVKVLDTNNLTDLNKMISSTNTEIVGKVKWDDGWYIIKATKNSKGDAIQMANYFSESKLFKYCELDYGYYPVE